MCLLISGLENKNRKIIGSNYRHTNRTALDSLKGQIANKTDNRLTFIEIWSVTMKPYTELMSAVQFLKAHEITSVKQKS